MSGSLLSSYILSLFFFQIGGGLIFCPKLSKFHHLLQSIKKEFLGDWSIQSQEISTFIKHVKIASEIEAAF